MANSMSDKAGTRDKSSEPGLDLFYRTYSGWLKRVLHGRFGRSVMDTEDVVQEAYIRFGRYPAQSAARNPKALLMTIAINLVRDEMRRNVVRSRLHHAADRILPQAMCMDALQEHPEELLAMKGVILALPPKVRDVFLLNRFGCMTYAEIASHLGISVKTVEWRMTKALSICLQQLHG